jgi:uncharacterized protein (TIGR02145 family)
MKRYFYSTLILFSFFYFLFFSGCKEGATEPQNHLPKIESLTANPTTVLISTETTLTCIATDEDGDNLTISWSSKRGTYSNGVVGVAVKWVAPSTAGKDTITAIVNDGKQTIQGKLEIIVGTVPASPTLAAPANNATEVALSPTLTWNAISNAVSYTLQVSANNSFSSFVYNQSGLTNTSQLISGLNSNATYYWRVSSTNIYGTSSWSSVFSFKTLAPPIAPTLLTPANNAIDISLTTTLNWNALINASSYTLQISENNSFTNFVYNQANLINPSQQISGLNYFTKYYWRVSATNSYGTSSWANFWTFITQSLQVPTLVSPVNNTTDVSITPTLSWNVSTDATSYTLQVSTTNSFSSYVYNQNVGPNSSQPISGLSNFTKYYWRVSATNNYGSSSWSSTWSFKTICIPSVTYQGKLYNTVEIGSQCWLKENLDVGIIIQNQNANNNGIIEKYCYNNDANNCNIYGGLYQWEEAMQYVTTEKTQGICPTGWHIPTKAEFETLAAAVNNNGNALKAIGQGTGSGAGTNTSGFSALLAGIPNYPGTLGTNTTIWSSTDDNNNVVYAIRLALNDLDGNIYLSYYQKAHGNSVRCLKD